MFPAVGQFCCESGKPEKNMAVIKFIGCERGNKFSTFECGKYAGLPFVTNELKKVTEKVIFLKYKIRDLHRNTSLLMVIVEFAISYSRFVNLPKATTAPIRFTAPGSGL